MKHLGLIIPCHHPVKPRAEDETIASGSNTFLIPSLFLQHPTGDHFKSMQLHAPQHTVRLVLLPTGEGPSTTQFAMKKTLLKSALLPTTFFVQVIGLLTASRKFSSFPALSQTVALFQANEYSCQAQIDFGTKSIEFSLVGFQSARDQFLRLVKTIVYEVIQLHYPYCQAKLFVPSTDDLFEEAALNLALTRVPESSGHPSILRTPLFLLGCDEHTKNSLENFGLFEARHISSTSTVFDVDCDKIGRQVGRSGESKGKAVHDKAASAETGTASSAFGSQQAYPGDSDEESMDDEDDKERDERDGDGSSKPVFFPESSSPADDAVHLRCFRVRGIGQYNALSPYLLRSGGIFCISFGFEDIRQAVEAYASDSGQSSPDSSTAPSPRSSVLQSLLNHLGNVIKSTDSGAILLLLSLPAKSHTLIEKREVSSGLQSFIATHCEAAMRRIQLCGSLCFFPTCSSLSQHDAGIQAALSTITERFLAQVELNATLQPLIRQLNVAIDHLVRPEDSLKVRHETEQYLSSLRRAPSSRRYISFQQFRRLCNLLQPGLPDKDLSNVLHVLHRHLVVSHFNVQGLATLIILDIMWVWSAMDKVLSNGADQAVAGDIQATEAQPERTGILASQALDHAWATLAKEEQQILMRLTQQLHIMTKVPEEDAFFTSLLLPTTGEHPPVDPSLTRIHFALILTKAALEQEALSTAKAIEFGGGAAERFPQLQVCLFSVLQQQTKYINEFHYPPTAWQGHLSFAIGSCIFHLEIDLELNCIRGCIHAPEHANVREPLEMVIQATLECAPQHRQTVSALFSLDEWSPVSYSIGDAPAPLLLMSTIDGLLDKEPLPENFALCGENIDARQFMERFHRLQRPKNHMWFLNSIQRVLPSEHGTGISEIDPHDHELLDWIERELPRYTSVVNTTVANSPSNVDLFRKYIPRLEKRIRSQPFQINQAGLSSPQKMTLAKLNRTIQLSGGFSNGLVRIALLWHGVASEDAADGILRTGLANFAREDSGYFGTGVYLTPQAEYALGYATKLLAEGESDDPPEGDFYLILCAVAFGAVYPVTWENDYDHDATPLRCHFAGTAPMTSHCDARYAEISKFNDHHCAREVGTGEFEEFVMNESSAVLPFAKVCVRVTKTSGKLLFRSVKGEVLPGTEFELLQQQKQQMKEEHEQELAKLRQQMEEMKALLLQQQPQSPTQARLTASHDGEAHQHGNTLMDVEVLADDMSPSAEPPEPQVPKTT
eukprot:m.228137 g.228137  ORF g.228137 m.228137 type:complete len:1234 (+) comp15188_c1_seq9:315-4016(+)